MLNLASFELRMNWQRTWECLIGNFTSIDKSLIFQILFKIWGIAVNVFHTSDLVCLK